MPRLEDIVKFKADLNSLGNELSILAERGELLEDVAPPEEGLSQDLSELLSGIEMDIPPEKPISEEQPEAPKAPDVDAEALGFEDVEFEEPSVEDVFGITEEDFLTPAEEPVSEEPVSEEPVVEEPEFEEPSFEEPAFEIPEAEEEISIPDIGEEDFALPEFDLGAEAEAGEEEFALPGIEEEPAGFGDEAAPEEEISVPEMEITAEETEGKAEFEISDEFEIQEEGEIREDEFKIDEFNLGDLGEHFGFDAEAVKETLTEEELNPALAVEEEIPEAPVEISLSEEDFEHLRRTLDSLPRNLKIIVEEQIGEKELSGYQLKQLVDGLVRGDSPNEIAKIAEKIIGKKIEIPVVYEKRTGMEFEVVLAGFAYRFRTNFLPIIKVVALTIIALGFLSFFCYRFIYTPLHAQDLYTRGHEEIRNDRYLEANEYFRRAWDTWKRKDWIYRYADGFMDKREYRQAGEKYEFLLRYYPLDKKGILDFASLKSRNLLEYSGAEKLLRRYLDRKNDRDYEILLALGDNYLAWAKEDPNQYEYARYTYAFTRQIHGARMEIDERFLTYFIARDDYENVQLMARLIEARESESVDPRVLAKLGGYYVNKGDLDEVRPVLFRGIEEVREGGGEFLVPELHYHLARYYKKTGEMRDEERALSTSAAQFDYLEKEIEPLTLEGLGMYIDTLNRHGRLLYERGEDLTAWEMLSNAKEKYESAKDNRLLGAEPRFGEIYANLGDISYYKSTDLDRAFMFYQEAQENEYATRQINYKKGYIQYRRDNVEEAIKEFYEAAGSYSTNPNLLYSTANSLYTGDNWFAAEGYYLHLLDILQTARDSIPAFLPEERDDHRNLLESLIRVNNNLGVTLMKLSDQTGDIEKKSKGLVYLTVSSDLFDQMTRDPETGVRSSSVNLAYLNTRGYLYHTAQFEYQIFSEIPRDMELSF